MSRPAFIAVVPAEVERYGGNAGIVLALIRYRTDSDGPGRLERDGHRWWRATLGVLVAETGLSVKAVRTALSALDGVVLANHFPPKSDQSLAYRVAPSVDALTSQLPLAASADQPVAVSGISDAATGTDHAPSGTAPCPRGHLYSSIENSKEGEEGGGGDESPAAAVGDGPRVNSEPATPEPATSGDDPPSDLPPADNDPTATAAPSRFCSKHPLGTDEACSPCGVARRAREQWDADAERAAADAERSRLADGQRARWHAIAACDLCDPDGYRAGRVCDHDPNRDAAAARGLAQIRAALATKPAPPAAATHDDHRTDDHTMLSRRELA